MKANSKEKYIKSAEIFKLLSNAKRLEILDIIKDREVSVDKISETIGIHKSNTSQHLTILRHLGMVEARRKGQNVFYKVSNSEVLKLLG